MMCLWDNWSVFKFVCACMCVCVCVCVCVFVRVCDCLCNRVIIRKWFSGVEERVGASAGLALLCWNSTAEITVTHTRSSGSGSVNKQVHTHVDMDAHTHWGWLIGGSQRGAQSSPYFTMPSMKHLASLEVNIRGVINRELIVFENLTLMGRCDVFATANGYRKYFLNHLITLSISVAIVFQDIYYCSRIHTIIFIADSTIKCEIVKNTYDNFSKSHI